MPRGKEYRENEGDERGDDHQKVKDVPARSKKRPEPASKHVHHELCCKDPCVHVLEYLEKVRSFGAVFREKLRPHDRRDVGRKYYEPDSVLDDVCLIKRGCTALKLLDETWVLLARAVVSCLREAVHRQEQEEGRLWDCHLEAFLERDGLFASRFQFLQPLVPAANVLKLEDGALSRAP